MLSTSELRHTLKFLLGSSCFTVLLVSAMQQRASAVRYLHPLDFAFPSHLGPRVLSRVPSAVQRVLLSHDSIHSINSGQASVPISQFFPPPSPLRLCLFSVSVSLLLLCK